MKWILYCLSFSFLCIPTVFYGQNSVDVSGHILKLHTALVSNDTVVLHDLLSDQLSYGHSNGWIETKEEMITNNVSKKMIYQSIKEDSIHIQVNGPTAIARFNAIIRGLVGEKTFHMKLHVCQTWIRTQNLWKLMARQAVKLETIE